jgi:hypothetical protein
MRGQTHANRILGPGRKILAGLLIAAVSGSAAWLAPLQSVGAGENSKPSQFRARPTMEHGVPSGSLRARLEAMPETDVKAFYARCSDASSERRLDGGEAMACSIGYEVLLQKHFNGDFEGLLSWSRRQPR